MNNHPAQPLLDRLDRLERFLQEDPQNETLLADAFETGLAAGAFDRAAFHLNHAHALGYRGPAWPLREAQWLLAQRRFDEASAVLEATAPEASGSLATAVAHDLAYIALKTGNFSAGLERLAPWLEASNSEASSDPALQVLWLRLLHRGRGPADAVAWARQREAENRLSPQLAGVAALAALDENDFDSCLRWSDAALRQGGPTLEALVARASAALAQRDVAVARKLLEQALHEHPDDGRSWSAMGYTDLLEQRLPQARGDFEKALAHMPEHIGTWHGLAWTLLLQGELDGAQRAFERALTLDRNFGESHGGLAVVLARRDDREGARQAIARALGLDVGSISARYAEAVLDGSAQDAQALQRLAHRLLGSRPALMGGTIADLLPQDSPRPR